MTIENNNNNNKNTSNGNNGTGGVKGFAALATKFNSNSNSILSPKQQPFLNNLKATTNSISNTFSSLSKTDKQINPFSSLKTTSQTAVGNATNGNGNSSNSLNLAAQMNEKKIISFK